jgi:N-acetylmuramoyl-L-alanine amidase
MKNVKVEMTRTTDVFRTLKQRTDFAKAKKGNLFISIHFNGFGNSSARGIEVFHDDRSSASPPVARTAQNELMKEFGGFTTNRGVKRARFYVLANTYRSMRSILTEGGFVTNAADARMMKRADFVERHAQALARTVYTHCKDGDVVVIDPGHGGSDPGAVGNGLREKDLVLAVGLRLRAILQNRNNTSNPTRSLTFRQRHPNWWDQTRAEIGRVQGGLQRLGYYNGPIDNHFGQGTLDAVREFQTDYNLSTPEGNFYGVPGPATQRVLERVAPSHVRILQETKLRTEPNRSAANVDGTVKEGVYTVVKVHTGPRLFELASGYFITNAANYAEPTQL